MDVIIMDVKDVPGECQITGFEKKIELLSYNHGVSMQMTSDVSNKERTSGKPQLGEFTVSKYVDVTTPTMNQNCCSAKPLGQVVITVGRNEAGSVMPLLVYTLDEVLVSSVSVGGGSGDKPTETLTLNYTKIKWDYTSQKSDSTKEGTASGVWDLKLNQAK